MMSDKKQKEAEEPIRAAIYTRVSSEEQVEKYGLPSQRDILTKLCEGNGWSYEIYEDAGISGKNITDRPAMRQLLEDADDDSFQAVCVTEWERLSRDVDLFDWMLIKKAFRENHIKVVTPSQTFDLEDDEGDFISDLFSILSKREKKKFLKRSMAGKIESVKAGKFPGGNVPYGYSHNRETHELEVDNENAEVIKQIFYLCNTENLGTDKIAQMLTDQGIPTHSELTGRPNPRKNPQIRGWSGDSVRGILINPVFCGKFAYRRKNGET